MILLLSASTDSFAWKGVYLSTNVLQALDYVCNSFHTTVFTYESWTARNRLDSCLYILSTCGTLSNPYFCASCLKIVVWHKQIKESQSHWYYKLLCSRSRSAHCHFLCPLHLQSLMFLKSQSYPIGYFYIPGRTIFQAFGFIGIERLRTEIVYTCIEASFYQIHVHAVWWPIIIIIWKERSWMDQQWVRNRFQRNVTKSSLPVLYLYAICMCMYVGVSYKINR